MFKSHKTHGPKTAQALTPSQVAQAYNFPTNLDLSHRTVAILELGGAFQLSDIVAYCNREGYNVPQIKTIFCDGATEQSDPNGADGEVGLDICVIAGVAQGCKIAVVFAPNSDAGFIDGLKTCVGLDPDAISISWGSPEDGWDPSSMASLDALMQQAAEKGIAVFCASGDNGSSDGESTGSHCDYPASSPLAIACGGTHLELNSDGTRLLETAWSSTGVDVLGNIVGSSEGSGGGISSFYNSTPNWQAGVLPNSPSGRRSPDVSGNADPSTGYQVDIDGTITQIGGTSAVAPLYAALQAILNASLNEHVGNLHTKIYQAPSCFFDITEGTNGAYNCLPGYDCVTGLGAINAQEFIQTLKGVSTAAKPSEESNPITDIEQAVETVVENELEKLLGLPAGGFNALGPKLHTLLTTAHSAGWLPEAIAIAKLVCEGAGEICPIIEQIPSSWVPKL